MRENCMSGSEGGGTGNLTGPSYPILAFVASHLACLSRHQGRQVCDVISGATQRYIKLQHKDQLRLAL